MHLIEIVENEMSNLMRDGESLSVRVVESIHADDCHSSLLQEKARNVVIGWRSANMNVKPLSYGFNVYGSGCNAALYEKFLCLLVDV